MEYDLVRKITTTVVRGMVLNEHIELADDGGVWAMATYPSTQLKMEKVDITVVGAIDAGICPFCGAQTDVYEMYYPRNMQTPLYYHVCHQCIAGIFEHEMGVVRPAAQVTPSLGTRVPQPSCSQGSCTSCPPGTNCHGSLPGISSGNPSQSQSASPARPVASSTACTRCHADDWEYKEIPDFWNSTKRIQVKKCRQCGNCP